MQSPRGIMFSANHKPACRSGFTNPNYPTTLPCLIQPTVPSHEPKVQSHVFHLFIIKQIFHMNTFRYTLCLIQSKHTLSKSLSISCFEKLSIFRFYRWRRASGDQSGKIQKVDEVRGELEEEEEEEGQKELTIVWQIT